LLKGWNRIENSQVNWEQDFYKVLGISKDGSAEDIRKAYFDLARRLHPDINPDPGANEHFILLQKAYDVLGNPQKRNEYDVALRGHGIPRTLSVDIKYSRSELPALEEAQLVYVFIEIINKAIPDPSNFLPVHLCLAIDTSTSMKGERMDMVKKCSTRLLRNLSSQDIVSIISFNDKAEIIVSRAKVSTLPKLEQQISLLYPSGGTEILRGLETAVEELGSTGENDGSVIRYLILFTDGHTYGDEEKCLEVIKKARKNGIVIGIIGIGDEWNDGFLDQLATEGGGNAVLATSSNALEVSLEQKIKQISSMYARNIRLDFTSDPNVQLRYAFRLIPDSSPLSVVCPINIGNLYYGKSISLIFEFLITGITQHSGKIRLANGQLSMDIPINKELVVYPISFQRPYTLNPGTELPPAILVEAMSKLTLYRLQERSRKEVAVGELRKATKHLQHLATHLLSDGERELARTVLVEAEHILQSNQFSKDGDKRIKYGTRALLLPSGKERKNDRMP
jgi:Ca-activated chloride channel homolog